MFSETCFFALSKMLFISSTLLLVVSVSSVYINFIADLNTWEFNSAFLCISLTLSGLSQSDGDVISYTIKPLDYILLHEDSKDGSIIKSGEKQMFNIVVEYEKNVSVQNKQEYNLSLGSTIIYKQK